MNQVILFKITTRSNPDGLISILYSLTEKLSDKENYKVLISADVDDLSTYNQVLISEIKPFIESKKATICFDYSKSKVDAINRDIETISDWDILVNLSDDIQITEHKFDENLRQEYLAQHPNLDGEINYSIGHNDVLVIGKKLHDKQGFVLKESNESKIKYNLLVNYYTDKNFDRGTELDYCLYENLRNEQINKVVLISSESDYLKLIESLDVDKELIPKLIPIITDKRPSYNDYFAITSKIFNGNNNINIISNLDIIIPPESLLQIPTYLTTNKTCLALTRWDVNVADDNYRECSTFFERTDSQDTWIFMGAVPQISGANFTLGKCGCDNAIAHILEQSGYNVINPSRTIKTYHFHITNIKNYMDTYGQIVERIPPPYKLLEPTL